MDFQTILPELNEKYTQVRKLLDVDDKPDDKKEPYKNKYAAIEILGNMHESLLKILNDLVQKESGGSILLAIVCLNLGILYIETDELKRGEDFLMSCIENLSKSEMLPQKIIPMISALNQLGILWSQRDQSSIAKEFLERSERVYKHFKNYEEEPVNMSTLFSIKSLNEPEPSEVLEKLHTLTLYYLAQIYGSMEDYFKSAVYCHLTLRRQLEYRDFESVEWALNAATLSQFFLEKEGFQQARHYLAAATYILQKYEDTLKCTDIEVMESEEVAAKLENFKHRSADIARCWVKYGILLLSASKERLLLKTENENVEETNGLSTQQDSKSELDKACLETLQFTTIEKEVEIIAEKITDKYLLDFNDARLVFIKIQKWLDDAKQYYCLENQASDYVQLVQDNSQAYKYLSFFEDNEDRQAKMHKRRTDILETVLKQLNEKYYQTTCRQIWIELGEIYSEILDIKLERLKATNKRPTPYMLSKINNLASCAIKYFRKFVDSLQGSRTFVESKTFPDELTRPALSAYFHLGRLYNKFIRPDKYAQLENVQKSFNAYAFLVNYCEQNSRAKELMTTELSVCKDFVKLLPLKISKLNLEIKNNTN